MTGRVSPINYRFLHACLLFFLTHMENNKSVSEALHTLITSTINSYLQTLGGDTFKIGDVLDALIKTYNNYLLEAYGNIFQQKVMEKLKEVKNGESTETDNKQ